MLGTIGDRVRLGEGMTRITDMRTDMTGLGTIGVRVRLRVGEGMITDMRTDMTGTIGVRLGVRVRLWEGLGMMTDMRGQATDLGSIKGHESSRHVKWACDILFAPSSSNC